MTYVAASGAWTGLPDDSYGDLSDAERHGHVAFARSDRRLTRDRNVCVAVAVLAGGAALWSGLHAMPEGAVGAIGHPFVLPLLLLSVVAAAAAGYLTRRLKAVGASAPLLLMPDRLLVGDAARPADFAAIGGLLRPAPVRNILAVVVVFLATCVFLLRRANMQTMRIELAGQTPLDIDLNVLEGDPEHIARVIGARIALAAA